MLELDWISSLMVSTKLAMYNKPTVMHGVASKDRICHVFKIFASHQKNGTVEIFELFLLDVCTSQLFKTADNSDNVLKDNLFCFKSLK